MTTCSPMRWSVSNVRRLRYLYPDGGNCAQPAVHHQVEDHLFQPSRPGTAEFEVILTEGSDTLSVIYGDTSGDNGLTAASGIQQDLSCVHVVLLLRSNPDTRRACGLHSHGLWESYTDPDGDSYAPQLRQRPQLQQRLRRQLRQGLRRRRGRAQHRRLARSS